MPKNIRQRKLKPDSIFVEQIVSAVNFGERQTSNKPSMVILHYTGMEKSDDALSWLCCEQSQVSCHYFIFEDGNIVQSVAEEKRAWHAGQSFWRGERDINSHSIGIEIANPGHEFGYVDFPAIQMSAVVKLVEDIAWRYNIPSANILAHSDVSPTRKMDPGERFNWQLLSSTGLGNWIEPSPIICGKKFGCEDVGKEVECFQTALRNLGFEITINGEFDALTIACTKAFQRHFRQEKIDGIADHSTVNTLGRLLDVFPGSWE